MHMSDVTRVCLPSGEEKFVPSPELEKALAERLKLKGRSIRRALRRHRKKKERENWFLKIIHSR